MYLLNKYKNKIEAVCHVNYHKRFDSNNDEKIVRDFCNSNNIRLFVKNVTKSEYDSKINFQSQARNIRYNFFKEISDKLSNKNLLIAHNLNDFLETAYMQISKNSKALYYGIKKRNSYIGLLIYRPIIRKRKLDIQSYCDKHKINYAIDSSNNEDLYERNRIRKIIYSWNEFQLMGFRLKIFFYNLKNFFFRKKIDKKCKSWNYDYNFFIKQSNRVKYYLVYQMLIENNIENNTKNKIENIIQFIDKYSNKKFKLNERKYIFIKKNKIIIGNY